ncbi:hypothetical protein MRBLBA21_001055 [Peribacillus frigoritolerans]|nr:hypothetical protein [Peribacillus frigoritolerans]MBD8136492.1 hypothetical protein [Bacillus sp. CFBP 13597]MCR8870181.1 hypothetical protein [Peribacillus frigoritolerans]
MKYRFLKMNEVEKLKKMVVKVLKILDLLQEFVQNQLMEKMKIPTFIAI